MHKLKTSFLIHLLAAGCCVAVACAEPTQIYGVKGEKWAGQSGPLPDFSFAGYQRGDKPLPERKPDASVKDYGAVGDGVADDTKAIQKALDQNRGKVVFFPEGRYLLSDVITIPASGTVLQGAGPDKTIFTVSRSLQSIERKPVEYPDTGGTAYAYTGGFFKVQGNAFYRGGAAHPVAVMARRGDNRLSLSVNHPFKVGDEVFLLLTDNGEKTLLRYLYRNEEGSISKLGGQGGIIRHVAKVTQVDGRTVTLDRPLRTDLRPEWQPALYAFMPRRAEIGIEHLAFEFPSQPYRGHFTEQGYNAIHFNSVAHSWVRNVRLKNADSGIFLSHSVFITIDGVVIESDREADMRSKAQGHHGVVLGSTDSLCTNFDFRAKYIHDVTVSYGSVGNVFSNGKGVDFSMDHHRRGPYENLFSNLDLGEGTRAFLSGGSLNVGKHAAAGNTYWNLKSKVAVTMPVDFSPERINLIGVKLQADVNTVTNPEGRWIENIPPGQVEPADLHADQLARRLGKH